MTSCPLGYLWVYFSFEISSCFSLNLVSWTQSFCLLMWGSAMLWLCYLTKDTSWKPTDGFMSSSCIHLVYIPVMSWVPWTFPTVVHLPSPFAFALNECLGWDDVTSIGTSNCTIRLFEHVTNWYFKVCNSWEQLVKTGLYLWPCLCGT